MEVVTCKPYGLGFIHEFSFFLLLTVMMQPSVFLVSLAPGWNQCIHLKQCQHNK